MMTTQTETNSKIPTHAVYIVEAKEGSDKANWLEVGPGWEHGDQNGENFSLNALGISYLQVHGPDTILTIRRKKPQA